MNIGKSIYGDNLASNVSMRISTSPKVVIPKIFPENLETKKGIVEIEKQTYVDLKDDNKIEKLYGKNWIVMQNRMIFAISNLNLHERRLVLFLSPLVRKAIEKDPTQRIFTVRVKDYNEHYQVNTKMQYDILKKVNDSMMTKYFTYWDFDKNGKQTVQSAVSWFSKSIYLPNQGMIEVELHSDVVEMLTVFDANNPFTKYQNDMIVSLGTYGLILLELVASFANQDNKQAAFTIKYLREKFNCVDTYPNVAEMKRRVLDSAIEDVNKHTAYIVSYEPLCVEGGRKITHFKFKVKFNKDFKKVEIDPADINKLEDKSKSKSKQEDKPATSNVAWKSKGLSDKQVEKLKIFAEEFVEANKNKVAKHEERMKYEEVIDSWKPMLQNSNYVHGYKLIEDILGRRKL